MVSCSTRWCGSVNQKIRCSIGSTLVMATIRVCPYEISKIGEQHDGGVERRTYPYVRKQQDIHNTFFNKMEFETVSDKIRCSFSYCPKNFNYIIFVGFH